MDCDYNTDLFDDATVIIGWIVIRHAGSHRGGRVAAAVRGILPAFE
jgi:hypothetical protein